MRYEDGPGNSWKFSGMEDLVSSNMLDGLVVSGDERNVYFEAMVPKIDPKTIKVSFKNGFLTVKAEKM